MENSQQSPAALDDLKVVELPALDPLPFFAASMAAKAMADLGAEVLKIEPPKTGAADRRFGPSGGGKPDPETRALHLFLDCNKLSATLDLANSRGHELLMRILGEADVVFNPNPPALNDRLGLAWRTLCDRFPRLVVVSTTYFGTDSRYRDFRGGDLVATQMSGVGFETPFNQVTDPPNQPPLRPAERQADYMTGYTAGSAAMVALQGRNRSGKGQHVDVSQWLAMVSTIRINVGQLSHDHPRTGMSRRLYVRRKTNSGWIYPCRDGFISFRSSPGNFWEGAVRMLGSPEWTRDPIFATELLRLKNSDAMDAMITSWFMEYSKEEIFQRAQAEGVPCFPLYNVGEVAENRQYRARDFFQQCEHPIAGRFKMPGPPYLMSRTPARVRRPAPCLGEHNVTIFCDRLGISRDELGALQTQGVI
ncbi:MAG TPA: CoA transferase [Candidatus Binataceae bacterium]|nr:CoA transferase [Candidatus Binataceae bacterium]